MTRVRDRNRDGGDRETGRRAKHESPTAASRNAQPQSPTHRNPPMPDTDKLVTDEMLDAGMGAYYRALRGEYDGHKNGLTAIYLAMHSSRPTPLEDRDKLIERIIEILWSMADTDGSPGDMRRCAERIADATLEADRQTIEGLRKALLETRSFWEARRLQHQAIDGTYSVTVEEAIERIDKALDDGGEK
jgi:hypothetical protein